jgi:hypothetical protein
MIKHIAVIALLCLTSSNSFASFINADDFDVGADTTQLTDKVTLSWLSGTNNQSPSSVHDSGNFYHQHFGGPVSAETHDTFPGIANEVLGSSNSYSYGALQIDFDTPTRSFGMKAETSNDDGFEVYLFGTNGNFVEKLYAFAQDTNQRIRNNESLFDGSFHWDFAFDVGRIQLGSSNSAGFIYALDVSKVPEPSSLILLGIGLLCVVKVRRSINVASMK